MPLRQQRRDWLGALACLRGEGYGMAAVRGVVHVPARLSGAMALPLLAGSRRCCALASTLPDWRVFDDERQNVRRADMSGSLE